MKGRKILLAFIISAIMLTSGCANGTSKTEEFDFASVPEGFVVAAKS